jgi:acyl carrier protein
MQHDRVADELERYVRANFLDGDEDEGLSRTTPLLQWGVLNSMNTALLLTHIRDHLGVDVPPTELNGSNFRDLDSITDLVVGLAASP